MKKVKSDKVEGFPEKYNKVLGVDVKQDIERLSPDEVKDFVMKCENSYNEQERLRDADESLKEAKENVKALSCGYKDAMKYQTAQIKYALFCLEQKGLA